jgi:hypothetical protein
MTKNITKEGSYVVETINYETIYKDRIYSVITI